MDSAVVPVLSAFHQFLSAFAQLQLDEMLACFADDATAFFPSEHQRLRLTGKPPIRAAFAQVLEGLRARGATHLPLEPEGVHVQAYGELAVITFHLAAEHLSR